jgi:hypothetical protein
MWLLESITKLQWSNNASQPPHQRSWKLTTNSEIFENADCVYDQHLITFRFFIALQLNLPNVPKLSRKYITKTTKEFETSKLLLLVLKWKRISTLCIISRKKENPRANRLMLKWQLNWMTIHMSQTTYHIKIMIKVCTTIRSCLLTQ